MTSLPTGGWTTYSPQPVPEHAWKMLVCPAMIRLLSQSELFEGLGSMFHSTPCLRIDHASLA